MIIEEKGGTTVLHECPSDPWLAQTGDARQLPEWIVPKDVTLECRICVVPEKDGRFSARALFLPDVVSHGETEEEAVHCIAEALRAAVEVYGEEGESIPWLKEGIPTPRNAKERRILVQVGSDIHAELADITPPNSELLKLAEQFPAPEEWYDE